MKYELLQSINSPQDLKELDQSQLRPLSDELRSYIIEVIDKVGGHLAPTLGVIELTVALHYLYDTPKDKIIWDVGHQAYAHKVLTGRRDRLSTIRQRNGLAPFCKPSESEYDVFGAGHASTSISAALGIATARDLQGEDYRVVSVIGDGSITGGLAYEGLNNVGAMRRQMTIVLNDNEMSISPNVGAIHHYLTKIVTNPMYNKIRDEIWGMSGKLPSGSRHVRYLLRKMEEGLKNMLTPGILFDELGIRYIGPIKGHDLNKLIDTFNSIKDIKTPVLVHVLTEKGKGYPNVESSPVRFHSVKGQNSRGNSGISQVPTYSQVFGKTAIELAKKDEKIVAITPAMREGSGLVEYSKQFPKRYFDVGIAEGHAVTFSAGLASAGLHPIVAIYSSFLQRGYDHLIHDVALQKLPVTFCLDRSGLVGGDGATHHGAYDISYMQEIPNLVISAPKDGNELRNLMYTAHQYTDGPFSIRYPKGSSLKYSPDADPKVLSIGSWERLIDGENIVVLATGSMVQKAELALRNLSKEGIRVGLVNARFIKPFDTAMLKELIQDYDQIVTIEENALQGGFGSTIRSYIEDELETHIHILRLGIPDKFIEHGSREDTLEMAGLSTQQIQDSVRDLVNKYHHVTAEVS